MIALAALLLAVPCDVEPVLRALSKASLPAQTARNVTAKVRYAETMCKLDRHAPASAREELAAARTMAPALASAIDRTIRAWDEAKDVPARLTIHTHNHFVLVDGVLMRPMTTTTTLQLRAGGHEVNGVPVTLAEGEPRSIDVPEPREPDIKELRQGYFIYPNIEPIVPLERLGRLCIGIHRGDNGERVTMKSIDRVTVEKGGTFEATDLFAVSERGHVCVADADALREIVRASGPASIHIVARSVSGDRVETGGGFAIGRTVVVSGTAPEGVRFVQQNGGEPAAVTDGRFTVTLPEEPTELVALGENKKFAFIHRAEFHCDTEVRLTKESLEIVSGGCPNGGAAWKDPEIPVWEDLQLVAFDFADGTIAPRYRIAHRKTDTVESLTEEALQRTGGEGVLQVRAYSENGTLVFRNVERLQLAQIGHSMASTGFDLSLPPTAATVEITGWTPQTSGRYTLREIPPPQ